MIKSHKIILPLFISLFSVIILYSPFSLLHSQCIMGFSITPNKTIFCTNSDSVKLEAWDTTNTNNCLITPGFLLYVSLDNKSIKENSIAVYENQTLIGYWGIGKLGNLVTNNLLKLLSNECSPNFTYSFRWCDKGKDGKFVYSFYDRDGYVLLAQDTIYGKDSCTTVILPHIKGIAIFSGPGVKNHTNGFGSFDPKLAGKTGNVDIKYYWDNQRGFKDSITRTVTINPAPTVIVNDTTIHSGCTATIKASGATTYLWNDSTTTNSIVVSPILTTAYSVTGTDPNGCSDIHKPVVTVLPPLNLNVKDTSVCQNSDSVKLSASGVQTYLWSTSQTSSAIKVKPIASAIYTITGTTPNCPVIIDTLHYNVIPNPVLQLASNSKICQDSTLLLFASTTNLPPLNNVNFSWTGPYNFSSNQQNPQINTAGYQLTDSYYYCIASYNNCISQLDSTPVSVFPKPVNFLSSDTILCGSNAITIKSKKSFSQYTWQDGSDNSSIRVAQPGTFTLRVKDSNGCSATNSINVQNDCPPVIFVPNAFAPGSQASGSAVSDSNSIFIPKGYNVTKLSMDIFSRWGSIVFHSDNVNIYDITTGWNGKFLNSNKDCPVGIYVYVIKYQGIVYNSVVKNTKKGSVVLLRRNY